MSPGFCTISPKNHIKVYNNICTHIYSIAFFNLFMKLRVHYLHLNITDNKNSPNKTDRHYATEILLKVALNTIPLTVKHAVLRSKSTDWLAQNKDNVPWWGNMSTCGLLSQ
jgi:hypothetical protein